MENSPESILAEFIRYNNWANRQVLEACRRLDEVQLAASLPGAYGSIRDTLEHIIEGEAFYVQVLTGLRPKPPFDWKMKPGLAEMKDFAAQVGEALLETIRRIRPTNRVKEEDGGNTFHYQALVVFIQIINHGVEHRTNITSILSASGITPPAVDGWGYLSAHEARFEYAAG